MLKPWDPADPRLTEVMLRGELVRGGTPDRAIAGLVRGGVLHRVRRGAYVDAAAWTAAPPEHRHVITGRCVLRTAKSRSVLSHLSSRAVWEVPLWDLPLDVVHLARADHRAGRREAGVCQHLGDLSADDVTSREGIPVTSPTRAAVEALTLTDVEHGLTIVNDLLRRGLTTPPELEAMMERCEQWPGSLHHRLVLRLADGRSGSSVGEGRTRWLLYRQGLPAPVPQYVVRREDGRVYQLDFAWPELGVWLEFDGMVKYQGRLRPGQPPSEAVVEEKRREDDVRRLTGWRCIRITWADLAHPERTARLIREFLAGNPNAA